VVVVVAVAVGVVVVAVAVGVEGLGVCSSAWHRYNALTCKTFQAKNSLIF
jgi:hypothetical protein